MRIANFRVLLRIFIILITINSIVLLSGGIGFEKDARYDTQTETKGNKTDISFREVAIERGLNYTVQPSNSITHGGVYVTDYNNDGWPDVLAVGGNKPILFKNSNGSFHRSDVLPTISRSVKSALFFDYNNNGYEDLLLIPTSGSPIFLENTGSDFERQGVGFDVNLTYGMGATAADYTGDGCVDVFIFQYGDWNDHRPVAARPNHIVRWGEDNGNSNYLFQGNCSKFSLAKHSGISGERWSLAASFVDLTGDGAPDIHVANDFNYDVIYLNLGNGSFEQHRLGANTNRNGMSSEVVDINNDGLPDLFVTNIYLPAEFGDHLRLFSGRMFGNNLLINHGDGVFVDQARKYGIRKGGWGWAASIADFDNDENREIFHSTQLVPIPIGIQNQARDDRINISRYINKHPYLVQSAFWDQVDGQFIKKNASAMGFEQTNGRGAAQFDFNRDGALDLIVAQSEGKIKLYQNQGSGDAVELIIEGNKTISALGTRVYVTIDNKTIMYFRNSRADFLSQETRTIHVGLQDNAAIEQIRIVWPDGTNQKFNNIEENQFIIITPEGIIKRRPLRQ